MKDWNVVISVYQDGFTRVRHALEKLGSVEPTPYHNVLVMTVDNPVALLESIERKTEDDPALYDAISRVAPVMQCFSFVSADNFKSKARPILEAWSVLVTGRTFHARLHRRGGRHELPSPEIEKFVDDHILLATRTAGRPATVSFDDPDAVIAVDTIDDRAGLALWTRDDLARHRLLRPG